MLGHQIDANGTHLHVVDTGPKDGSALVLLHALGTDQRIWDEIAPHLPTSLRLVRIDMRGHGLSACPAGPYKMGALVSDTERVLEQLNVKDAGVLGLSIGGMIAQGLAVKRLDLVRSIILSNTAAKIGTSQIWADRIETAQKGGLESIADATLERWFPEPFRSSAQAALIRRLFVRQPLIGWAGCAAAIGGTDLITPTSGLRLPTLAIAADRDGSTPPDLVRETADLIPGSSFHLIRGAGHLPCVDAPKEFAGAVKQFLRETGHV